MAKENLNYGKLVKQKSTSAPVDMQPVDNKTVDYKLGELKVLVNELDGLNAEIERKINPVLYPDCTEKSEEVGKANVPVNAPLVNYIQEIIDVVALMHIKQQNIINRIKL